jgi:hypothetical protein
MARRGDEPARVLLLKLMQLGATINNEQFAVFSTWRTACELFDVSSRDG